MSIKTWILEKAGGEPIEAIVLSTYDLGVWSDRKVVGKEVAGKVISWSEAEPILDRAHRAGGKPDFTAWTKSWVIVTGCFECDWWIVAIPRNPTDHEPEPIGG